MRVSPFSLRARLACLLSLQGLALVALAWVAVTIHAHGEESRAEAAELTDLAVPVASLGCMSVARALEAATLNPNLSGLDEELVHTDARISADLAEMARLIRLSVEPTAERSPEEASESRARAEQLTACHTELQQVIGDLLAVVGHAEGVDPAEQASAVRERAEEVVASLARLMGVVQAMRIDADLDSDALLSRLVLVVFVVGLGLPTLGLLLGHRLAQATLRAVNALRSGFLRTIEGIADGRAQCVVVPPNAPRELAELAVVFNELGDTLVTTLDGRQRAEREAREAGRAALVAAQHKAQFLANMSHEIRTPLNGVLGMTELLSDTRLTREQREFLDIMRSSGDTLLRLINDILDFSRIEADRIQLDVADFSVTTLAEETTEMLAYQAHDKSLELACRIDPAAALCLRGDPGRLQQVLINLLGNAVKFTDRGEVVLEVSLARKTEAGVTLDFVVRDTGIGIPSEVHAGLFEPFVQADGSTTRKFGGSGLGLAISKRLVELMGGRIDLESEVGAGTTFRVRMPFEVAATGTEPGPVAADLLRNRRILVVDDNETNRRILRAHLCDAGAEVQLASSPEEAMDLHREACRQDRPFAAAVLDLQMPTMDGLTLATRLREEPRARTLPVCLLTSTSRQPFFEPERATNIDAWLTKPIRRARLIEALGGLVGAQDVRDVTALEPPAPLPGSAVERLGDAQLDGLQVLVAEDNPTNQLVIRHILTKLGCRAMTVGSGSEAMMALASRRFDVVLMDCQMPEMDGFEATRLIRDGEGEFAHTPIVALTANAMTGDRERCLAAGMDDYLPKPVRMEDLYEILSHWSRRRTPGRS